MTTDDLHARLEYLFPAFNATLINSVFIEDDGRFTPHGLCAEFSHFYCEHVAEFGSAEKAELFHIVETLVASDPDDQNPLANALCTCFLENISCTEAGEASQPLMGPVSRAYFDHWHVCRSD
jgi:hypothetical protein